MPNWDVELGTVAGAVFWPVSITYVSHIKFRLKLSLMRLSVDCPQILAEVCVYVFVCVCVCVCVSFRIGSNFDCIMQEGFNRTSLQGAI